MNPRSTKSRRCGRPEAVARLAKAKRYLHWAEAALEEEDDDVAAGPSIAPSRIEVLSSVSRFENGETVELPNVDDIQPSWQLFAIRAASTENAHEQPENTALFLGKHTDRESIEAAAAATVEAAYERAGTPLPEETRAELARRRAERHADGGSV